MAPRVATPLLMIAAPHRGRTSEPQFPNRRHKRNHSGYPNLGVSGTPTSSARSRALSRSLARSALLVEVTLRKSPPRLSSVVAVVQQVEFVCWIRDSAGLDNQMTGSRSGPHMNTSNRKMCCRGCDNNTNQSGRGKNQITTNKQKAGARWLRESNAEHTQQAFRLSAWNHINQTEGSYILTRKALNSVPMGLRPSVVCPCVFFILVSAFLLRNVGS